MINSHIFSMLLTNYTVQINFFSSHFKVLIQGQFSLRNNTNSSNPKLPLPQSPLKFGENHKEYLSTSRHDVHQKFSILFVNNHRKSHLLNTHMVLRLLKDGPSCFCETSTADIGCSVQQLWYFFKLYCFFKWNLIDSIKFR